MDNGDDEDRENHRDDEDDKNFKANENRLYLLENLNAGMEWERMFKWRPFKNNYGEILHGFWFCSISIAGFPNYQSAVDFLLFSNVGEWELFVAKLKFSEKIFRQKLLLISTDVDEDADPKICFAKTYF